MILLIHLSGSLEKSLDKGRVSFRNFTLGGGGGGGGKPLIILVRGRVQGAKIGSLW